MRPQIVTVAFCCLIPLLTGCVSTDPLDRIAREEQLQKRVLAAGDFELVVVGRPWSDGVDDRIDERIDNRVDQRVDALIVYFGSDGRPWLENRPAADPTGRRSLGLNLMLQDPRPAVYLGRPCYHGGSDRTPCEPRLWTSGRYSEIVVDAMATGLRTLVERHRPDRLTLVGYSGGGTLAVLAAARMSTDTDLTVITIAANLDPAAWTTFHDLLPLSGSLNPVHAVPSPSPFRQVHLVGTADVRVPMQTIQRYRERHPDARVLEMAGFDHVCCWVRDWPDILETIPPQ